MRQQVQLDMPIKPALPLLHLLNVVGHQLFVRAVVVNHIELVPMRLNQPHRRIVRHTQVPAHIQRIVRVWLKLLRHHALCSQSRYYRPVDSTLHLLRERLIRRARVLGFHPVAEYLLLHTVPPFLLFRQLNPLSLQAIKILIGILRMSLARHAVLLLLPPGEEEELILQRRELAPLRIHSRTHNTVVLAILTTFVSGFHNDDVLLRYSVHTTRQDFNSLRWIVVSYVPELRHMQELQRATTQRCTQANLATVGKYSLFLQHRIFDITLRMSRRLHQRSRRYELRVASYIVASLSILHRVVIARGRWLHHALQGKAHLVQLLHGIRHRLVDNTRLKVPLMQAAIQHEQTRERRHAQLASLQNQVTVPQVIVQLHLSPIQPEPHHLAILIQNVVQVVQPPQSVMNAALVPIVSVVSFFLHPCTARISAPRLPLTSIPIFRSNLFPPGAGTS